MKKLLSIRPPTDSIWRQFLTGTFALVCLAWTLKLCAAENQADESKLLSPEEEVKTFQIEPGFDIQLFAAEPMIANPIHMNFDAQGRLWVLCSSGYPQIQPSTEPKDKLIILQDTNGDGRADQASTFADGLMIPTGFALGDQGVYVGQGTELLHLRDSNGDGKADQTRVVLSGFGTGDAHHFINTFVWGPGGELYFNQGWNLYSKIETPKGVTILDRSGIFRFRPRTLDLDVVLANAMIINYPNPWGHAIDAFGQSLICDGAGGGLYH